MQLSLLVYLRAVEGERSLKWRLARLRWGEWGEGEGLCLRGEESLCWRLRRLWRERGRAGEGERERERGGAGE